MWIHRIVAAVLIASLFTACGGRSNGGGGSNDSVVGLMTKRDLTEADVLAIID